MIECIFTLDYEIYGNGQGSLRELVYEPAEKLKEMFIRRNVRFVNFVEVAELEMIEAKATDDAIGLVKKQIRDFYQSGFELGLHLHPQWYKARYEQNGWSLDYSEYNLCNLDTDCIRQYIDRSIAYLRKVLELPDFKPFSFRAGNWLLQPAQSIAQVLTERGIQVDSSVFKGGLQHKHRLDYRQALGNGYYWRFSTDVNVPDTDGNLLEIPTYTEMVFPWRMYTRKRVSLNRKSPKISHYGTILAQQDRIYKFKDWLRIHYPLKFDFCRMTLDELVTMIDGIIKLDRKEPATYKPIVAIGHSKDLLDFETVQLFLDYLNKKGIPISIFKDAYNKCIS